jgi:hypothetical protein
MYLSSEELKYIKHVLYCASSFTIARAEQVVSPSIKHEEIKRKIDDELRKVHWK